RESASAAANLAVSVQRFRTRSYGAGAVPPDQKPSSAKSGKEPCHHNSPSHCSFVLGTMRVLVGTVLLACAFDFAGLRRAAASFASSLDPDASTPPELFGTDADCDVLSGKVIVVLGDSLSRELACGMIEFLAQDNHFCDAQNCTGRPKYYANKVDKTVRGYDCENSFSRKCRPVDGSVNLLGDSARGLEWRGTCSATTCAVRHDDLLSGVSAGSDYSGNDGEDDNGEDDSGEDDSDEENSDETESDGSISLSSSVARKADSAKSSESGGGGGGGGGSSRFRPPGQQATILFHSATSVAQWMYYRSDIEESLRKISEVVPRKDIIVLQTMNVWELKALREEVAAAGAAAVTPAVKANFAAKMLAEYERFVAEVWVPIVRQYAGLGLWMGMHYRDMMKVPEEYWPTQGNDLLRALNDAARRALAAAPRRRDPRQLRRGPSGGGGSDDGATPPFELFFVENYDATVP
ncbi:unnamed protein product, partial [Phaeothamnion confervicola]